MNRQMDIDSGQRHCSFQCRHHQALLRASQFLALIYPSIHSSTISAILCQTLGSALGFPGVLRDRPVIFSEDR